MLYWPTYLPTLKEFISISAAEEGEMKKESLNLMSLVV